jgi:hypothetical protein
LFAPYNAKNLHYPLADVGIFRPIAVRGGVHDCLKAISFVTPTPAAVHR